jgi:hypothetical protein
MHYMRQSSGTGAGSGDTVTIGPCLDSAGAEYTGLVIGDLTITKNGSSAAMAANATLTHTSNGFYDLVMIGNNADTVGKLTIRCNKSTYQIPPAKYVVLTAVAYDALVANGTIASSTSGRTITVSAGGKADANLAEILGTALTETAGQIAGGFKKFFNVAAPTGTLLSLPDALPRAAGGVCDVWGISGDSVAADNLEAAYDGTGYAHTGNTYPWTSAWDAEVESEVTDALTAFGVSVLTQANIRTAVGLATANLDTQLDALPTAAEITTAVWAAAARTLTTLDEDSTTIDLDGIFSAAVCNKIADHVLRRDNANVEASINGDTLDINSLYGIIQQIQLSNTVDNAGFLTIYKTDGTTELAQLALAVDASADPTTGIG